MRLYGQYSSFFRRCAWSRAISTIALLLLLSLQATAAPESSGTWTSTLTADLAPASIELKTDFTVGLALGEWEMRTRTVVDRGAWRQQNLTLLCAFGQVDIKSDLRFEPHLHRFRDWVTRLRWRDNAKTLTLTPKLTRSTNWLILEAEHTAGIGELSARARWRARTGSCVLVFHDTQFEIASSWCGVDSEVEIALNQGGFDEFTLSLSDLTFDTAPWLLLDLELAHSVDDTVITVTHNLLMPVTLCSDALELTLLTTWDGPLALSGLRISKAMLSWAIDDCTLEITACLDEETWIRKTYWLQGEATGRLPLGSCGTLTVDLSSLWTEEGLAEMSFSLTHKPTSRRTIAVSWSLSPQDQILERISLLAQVKW